MLCWPRYQTEQGDLTKFEKAQQTQYSFNMALRAMLSKLHPPLPLSPRESEQLLSSLTSSFKRHLAEEPPLDTTNGLDSASEVSETNMGEGSCKLTAEKPSNRSRRNSSSTSVNQHLGAILSSPLFSLKPTQKLPGSDQEIQGTKESDQIQHSPSNLTAWFDEHVAMGTATQKIAERYLETLLKAAEAQSDKPVAKRKWDAHASSRVLKWLWSSGASVPDEFVKTARLGYFLISFLVAEGHADLVRSWIETRTSSSDWLRSRGILLKTLVFAEDRYGKGPGRAVEHFLQVATEPLVDPVDNTPLTTEDRRALLVRAGKSLLRALQSNTFQVSEDRFQRFLQSLPQWHPNPRLARASLLLYRRWKPDSSAALDVLRDAAASGEQPLLEIFAERAHEGRHHGIHFALRTAQVLLIQERHADARWVLELLQKKYPKDLGLPDRPVQAGSTERAADSSKMSDELVNLRLLDGLKVS